MLKMTVLASGTSMPAWVEEATQHYRQRLQTHVQFKLNEYPIEKRSKSQSTHVYLKREAMTIQAAIPKASYLIALDAKGASFTSVNLAKKLTQLQLQHAHVCFVIGGPDGLDPPLLASMHETWSLSPLTFSHPLARVVLLEALYRAYAILNNHPYHR